MHVFVFLTSYWSPAHSRAKPARPETSETRKWELERWNGKSHEGRKWLTLHLDVKFSHLAFQFTLKWAHMLQRKRKQLIISNLLQQVKIQNTESYTQCTCWPHQYKHADLRSVTNLCTFLITLVGFTQALSGLPAASGRVKGCHHLTCPITQPPLYTVCIVQLLNLGKQILKRLSTEESHQFTFISCLCYFMKMPSREIRFTYSHLLKLLWQLLGKLLSIYTLNRHKVTYRKHNLESCFWPPDKF